MTTPRRKRDVRTMRLDVYDPHRVVLPKALMRRVKVRRLGRTAGYTAWIVDGAVVRAEVDIDFAIGGNPARYAYIPENEIWLEDTGDEDDVKATFMHEVMEADIMRRGYGYDQAHEWASEGELAIRSLGEGRGLPHFVENPEDHSAEEETAQEIAAHGHFGFWLSPDGRAFIVESAYEHASVAVTLLDVVLRVPGAAETDPEFYLDDNGWLRCMGLPGSFQFAAAEETVFTQAQLDFLFDLARSVRDVRVRRVIMRVLDDEMKRRDEVRGNPYHKTIAAGHCFDWAWQKIAFDPDYDDAVLVHGTVAEPFARPPRRYAHAWLEQGGVVRDWQCMEAFHGGKWQGRGYPIEVFDELFQPKRTARYTQEQALALGARTGHYGPWTKKDLRGKKNPGEQQVPPARRARVVDQGTSCERCGHACRSEYMCEFCESVICERCVVYDWQTVMCPGCWEVFRQGDREP